ncbi:MAG: endolytic transglycosylase MltG [Treponema sp.]
MKKIFVPVLVFIIFAGICSGIFGYFKSAINSPCSDSDSRRVLSFEVKDGMTARYAGKILEEEKIINNSDIFYFCARFPKIAALLSSESSEIFSIKKGYYELSSEMTVAEIFRKLSSGKEKYVTVSIPEGLTVTKIARRLEEAGFGSAEDFIYIAKNDGKKIFSSHGLKINSDSVEGFLFPDTYNIPVSYTPEKIIDMMIDNLLSRLKNSAETSKAQSLSDDDFYKIMILASIIEREYRSESEAPLISSVFRNRLDINMALQSCATVEYIITEIFNKPHPKIITYDDLEIQNPYNTYKYPGLPPSPISNPGFTAISAALNPQESSYLYFTLTDSENGTHTFSNDLNSHVKATNQFRTKRMAGN